MFRYVLLVLSLGMFAWRASQIWCQGYPHNSVVAVTRLLYSALALFSYPLQVGFPNQSRCLHGVCFCHVAMRHALVALVLTMLDIRTCAGTIRCMHHGSTDSGQCWKDCTWGESWRCRISIEDMTKSCRTFLDLNCNPQIHPSRTSALALMDLVRPSTGGTGLSPSIPLQIMAESRPVEYQTHPFWRGAPRYVRRPQMGCCDFAGADWLAPHRHHSLRLGKVTPSLSSCILIYHFSDHVMNHVGSLWNPWFWDDLPWILWFIMIWLHGSLTSLGWLTRGDGPGESLGSGRRHWVHHGLVLQRQKQRYLKTFFAIFIPRNLTALPGAQVHFARNCLCPGSLKLSTSLTSWLFNFHHLFICKTCAADFSEFSRQAHPGIWSVDLRPVLHSLWHLKRCEDMWRHMTQAWLVSGCIIMPVCLVLLFL